ncbi:MAG TPA: phosphoglycerate kinase, partial [Thermoanaerobaculia bacterium]|nr:phosphoglycerate kinase [Thermoanaerobaculia bacterium]
MTNLLTLDDLNLGSLRGKRVFVRVDFNVPMSESGEVLDATRIEEVVPTLKELRDAGCILLLASHAGRPKGKRDPKYTLRPVAAKLSEILHCGARFAPDCIGPEVESIAKEMGEGDVLLLENLRFHEGEEKNDPAFADQLAALAEAFVDDAFGSAHRAHASVVGVPERLDRKAAGRLLAREVDAL